MSSKKPLDYAPEQKKGYSGPDFEYEVDRELYNQMLDSSKIRRGLLNKLLEKIVGYQG